MGERGDVTCSKGPGFEPQLAAYVYVLNFAMPWPPHTSFVSHLGHPSKNVLDTPLPTGMTRPRHHAGPMEEGPSVCCYETQIQVQNNEKKMGHLSNSRKSS